MADIKFACPHCNQHITCDELWGGHQLECPNCKNPIAVPAAAAPPPKPPRGKVTAPLVPNPPASAEPRLALNTAQAAEAAPAQKSIPIRNLAPPAPKKRSPLVTYGSILAVLVVLGVAAYFGYGYVDKMQDKVNTASKEAAKNADGGEVAHIAKLNNVLDATDPNRVASEAGATRPRQRRSGVGQEIPMAA